MSEQKPDGRLASDLCDQLGPMVEAAGMVSVLNHGSGSCVYSEGCHGVTQEHLERFAELVRADERERWQRIAAAAQEVTTGAEDRIVHFRVPSHLMAALALALDEGPNVGANRAAVQGPR